MPPSYSSKPYQLKIQTKKSSLSSLSGIKKRQTSGSPLLEPISQNVTDQSGANTPTGKMPSIHEIYTGQRKRKAKRKAVDAPQKKKNLLSKQGRSDLPMQRQSMAVGPLMSPNTGGMGQSGAKNVHRSPLYRHSGADDQYRQHETSPQALSPPRAQNAYFSGYSPDKYTSVTEKKQFIRDRMQRLIPIQTEEDVLIPGVSQSSLLQRYENAKTRIARLWEWLEIPQEERRFYIQSYFPYPSVENMKVLNRQIENLLAHRVDVLRVLTKISEREGLLRKLYALIYRFEDSRLDKRSLVLAEAGKLLSQLRTATKKCVEAIGQWSEALTISKPFVWNGEDYKAKIAKDNTMLASSKLVRILADMSPQKRQQLYEDAYGPRKDKSPVRSTQRVPPEKLHTEKRFHERYHFTFRRAPPSPPTDSARQSIGSLFDELPGVPNQHTGPNALSRKGGREAPSPHTISSPEHKLSPLQNRLPTQNNGQWVSPSKSHNFAESFHTYHTPEHHHRLSLSHGRLLDAHHDAAESQSATRASTSPLRPFSEHFSEASFTHLDEDLQAYSPPLSPTYEDEFETAEIPHESPPEDEFWATKRSAHQQSTTRIVRLAPLQLPTHRHSDPLIHIDDLGAQTHRPHTQQDFFSHRLTNDFTAHSARHESQTPPLPNIRSLQASSQPIQARRRHTLAPLPSGNRQLANGSDSDSHQDATKIKGFIPTLRDDRDNKMIIIRNKMKTVIGRADFSETLHDLVREDEAALTIQCAARRFLGCAQYQEQMREYGKFCEQVVFVQSIIRCHNQEYAAENRAALQLGAAIKIQGIFRGFLARREASVRRIVKAMEKERKMLLEQQTFAAVIIQSNLRGLWERNLHQHTLNVLRSGVDELDRGMRSLVQQIAYRELRRDTLMHLVPLQIHIQALAAQRENESDFDAVVLTQSLCRRFLALQDSSHEEKSQAALVVQKCWRRSAAYHSLESLRAEKRYQQQLTQISPLAQSWIRAQIAAHGAEEHCRRVVWAQSGLRSILMQKAVEELAFNRNMHLKRETNAVKIQSQFRGHLARKKANEIRIENWKQACCIRMQSCIRRSFAQQQLQRLLLQKMLMDNATTIQCAFRAHLARLEMNRLKEEQQRQKTAKLIQRVYREHLIRRHLSAQVIQRAWKCHESRTQLARLRWGYEQRWKSVLCLQRAWRCFQARKALCRLRDEFNRRNNAARLIQSTYLRYRHRLCEVDSACRIQRAYRCHVARGIRDSLLLRKHQIDSIPLIQRHARMSLTKHAVQDLQWIIETQSWIRSAQQQSFVLMGVTNPAAFYHDLDSIGRIQRVWRGFKQRQRDHGPLISHLRPVASTLQAIVRTHNEMQNSAKFVSAIIAVQSICRTRLFQQRSLCDFTKIIQRVVRMNIAAHTVSEALDTITAIQSIVRTYQVYQEYGILRSHFVFHWTEQMVGNASLQDYCALVIQQAWRRHVALKRWQYRVREVRATTIQCAWRRFASMKRMTILEKESSDALHKHMTDERFAVQIQRFVRGHLARRLAHRTRLHDKEALIRSLYSSSFEKVSEEMERMQSIHNQSLRNLLSNIDELQEKHDTTVQRVSEDVSQLHASHQQELSRVKHEMSKVYAQHSEKVSQVDAEILRLRELLLEAENRQKKENTEHIQTLRIEHDESLSSLNAELQYLRKKLKEAEDKQHQQNLLLRQMEQHFMEQILELKRSLQLKQDAFTMDPHQIQQRAHVVITIQRIARGFLARRKARHLKELCGGNVKQLREWRKAIAEIEEFYLVNKELRRLRAISTIQGAFRQFKNLQEFKERKKEHDSFAERYVVPIQSLYRGYRDRKTFHQRDQATLVITRFLRRVHKKRWVSRRLQS